MPTQGEAVISLLRRIERVEKAIGELDERKKRLRSTVKELERNMWGIAHGELGAQIEIDLPEYLPEENELGIYADPGSSE